MSFESSSHLGEMGHDKGLFFGGTFPAPCSASVLLNLRLLGIPGQHLPRTAKPVEMVTASA